MAFITVFPEYESAQPPVRGRHKTLGSAAYSYSPGTDGAEGGRVKNHHQPPLRGSRLALSGAQSLELGLTDWQVLFSFSFTFSRAGIKSVCPLMTFEDERCLPT
jgi:hypothetical protein